MFGDERHGVDAEHYWNVARRKAAWNRLTSAFSGKETKLIDFDHITQKLHLRSAQYKGTQNIPLDKIVGSVGRYSDFTGTFLPTTARMRERWTNVAQLFIDPDRSPPPIECYKVGDVYFVKDGNHRVSVANQLNLPDIDAYIWEYPSPVAGLEGGDIDTLLLEYERQDFLECTHLDDLRPEHNIRFTSPGGYTDVLRQIAHYQEVLVKIDEETIPYNDAVTAWFDMIYETSVQIIDDMGMLKTFPDRTPADAFIWITHYRVELEERYGRNIRLSQAVRKLADDTAPRVRKIMNTVKKVISQDNKDDL